MNINIYNKEKTILLTGSSGHIGQNLLESLEAINFPMKNVVLTYNRSLPKNYKGTWLHKTDLTNKEDVKNLFRIYKFSHIIHLAALASPSSEDFDGFYDLNLKSTHYLLEYCPNPVDFIFASSILYYAGSGAFYESDPPKPDSVYGITKVACEQLINMYAQKGKVRPRILRLCGNVGKYMTHGLITQTLNGRTEFNLKGKSPGPFAPICHVSDTCNAITSAVNYNKPGVTLNISPDDCLSLEERILLVNPNAKITWDGIGKENDLLTIYNDRANYELSWQPKYTSREAIVQMLVDNKHI